MKQFGTSKKEVMKQVAEQLIQRIVVKKGGLFLAGNGGGKLEVIAKGDTGKAGLDGKDGRIPKHEIDGYKLRFENPDGTWSDWLDLTEVIPKDGYTPVKGKDYFDGKDGIDGKDGKDGDTPVKDKDYFDGKDGYTPVKGKDYFDGKDGESIKGDKGDIGGCPEHKWDGTNIRFQNPDGSWGKSVELKGDKGNTGGIPAHRWQNTCLQFQNPDGSWGKLVELKGQKGDQGESIQGNPGPKGDKGSPGIAPTEVAYLTNTIMELKAKL